MNRNKVQIEIDIPTQNAVRNISRLQQGMSDAVKRADEFRKAADKASKALEKLDEKGVKRTDDRYVKARDAANDASNAYRKANEEVQRFNSSIQKQIDELGMAGLTQKELNKYLAEQNRLFNSSIRGSEQYLQAIENIRRAQDEMATRRQDRAGAVGFFEQYKSMLSNSFTGGLAGGLLGGMASAGIGAAAEMLSTAIGKISEKIDGFAERSTKISKIKNAIGGTTEEAIKLNQQIGQIDTSLDMATRSTILIESGKLNVPTEQLVAYNEAMAEAVIAMKEDFPGGVDEIVQGQTKIKGLFKDTKDLNYPDSVRKIGSAMKGLADTGTATASWQTEFLLRMGQLDEKVRPTITDLMGLGAALEESGMTDEIAASGVQSVLFTAYKNTELFSKFFKMSQKDFRDFINSNPNGFLLQFAERLKPLAADQQMLTLKNLKIESQEAAKVLGTLGNKTEAVIEKQAQANSYFVEGTRITKLYAEENDNTAGKVERAWNKMANGISNSKIMLTLGGVVNSLADVALRILDTSTQAEKLNKEFKKNDITTKETEAKIGGLLKRYEELIGQQNRSASAQKELNSVINAIKDIVPSAVTEYDKYGKALSVNVGLLNDYIQKQKESNLLLKNRAIGALNTENNQLGGERAALAGRLALLQNYVKENPLSKSLYGPEMAQLSNKLSEINKQINANKQKVKDYNTTVKVESPTSSTTTTTGTGTAGFNTNDKALKEVEKQAEAQRINAQRLKDDLEQMNIELINNEADRKEAQIRYSFKREDDTNKELVNKKELTESAYLKWRETAYKLMLQKVAQNDEDTNNRIAEKVKETNTKALVNRIELHKNALQSELETAKDSGDLDLIYAVELDLALAQHEIDLAKATADEKALIESNYLLKKDALYAKYLKDKTDKDTKDASTEKEIKEKTIKAEEDARRALFEKIAQWQNAIGNLVGAFFDLQSQEYQNQQTREDNVYNKKIQNLESQKNKGIITEAEYNNKKTQFEKDHDAKSRAIKQKAAESDKVARIAQAVMTTAQAVINAFAVGKDPISIAALAATAGIVGALQVAKISNTEIPQYYDGNWTHRTSSAGIDGRGGQMAIVHPNEFIVNARATSTPAFAALEPILSTLNQGRNTTFQQNTTYTTSTTAPPQNNDAMVKMMAQMMATNQALLEVLPNIQAQINWGYGENQEFDRMRKKYQDSNDSTFIQ